MDRHTKPIRPQSDEETLSALNFWATVLQPLPLKEENMINNTPIKATIVSQQNVPTYQQKDVPTYEHDDYDPFLDSEEKTFDTHSGSYTVNTTTGEAVRNLPVTQEDSGIQEIILNEVIPPHIRELEKLVLAGMTKEDAISLLSVFDTPTTVKNFKLYRGKNVDIYGGIIWYHPPFISNGKGRDKGGNVVPVGEQAEGFYQIRLLTMEEGEPVIITASFGALASHIYSLLGINGWYIWDQPVTYRLDQDPNTNAFQMVNQERVKALLLGMKKTGKK